MASPARVDAYPPRRRTLSPAKPASPADWGCGTGALELPHRVLAVPCGGGVRSKRRRRRGQGAGDRRSPRMWMSSDSSSSSPAGDWVQRCAELSEHTLQLSPPTGSPVSHRLWNEEALRPDDRVFADPAAAATADLSAALSGASPRALDQVVGQIATLFKGRKAGDEPGRSVLRRETSARLSAMRDEADERVGLCMAAARGKVTKAKAEAAAERRKAAAWKAKAEHHERAALELRLRVQEAEMQHNDHRRRRGELELELEMQREAHRAAIGAALGDSSPRFSDALRAAEREATELARRVRSLEREKGRMSADLAASRRCENSLRSELQQARAIEADMKSDLQHARLELQLCRQTPAAETGCMALLRSELEEMRAEKQLLQSELLRVKGAETAGGCSAELAALRAASQTLSTENDRLRANLADQGSPGSPRIGDMEGRIALLERALQMQPQQQYDSPTSPTVRSMERKIVSLEALVEQLTSSLVSKERQENSESVVEALRQVTADNDKMRASMSELEQEHRAAQKEITAATEALRVPLGIHHDRLCDAVSSAVIECLDLRSGKARLADALKGSEGCDKDVVDRAIDELRALHDAKESSEAQVQALEKKQIVMQAKIAEKKRTVEQMRGLLQLHMAQSQTGSRQAFKTLVSSPFTGPVTPLTQVVSNLRPSAPMTEPPSLPEAHVTAPPSPPVSAMLEQQATAPPPPSVCSDEFSVEKGA
eukprot:TRINITY_DN7402_c0_g1_i1.p1 TRINITY_DN7402_c0_g1~~TRINITY_DN7402_c0_g1_i1.p1  ORF type:complete len:718 (+),score=162.17 TRINITY_DN7402_c0_g1_i1:45-2198(+)